ncbi:MAG: S1 RNA-binding domain-containing protein [Chitinispirillaceae bacterium]|nr:S1 RNA-binding domain-containing protein [Chitinispirillaceae bacterium]
MLDKKDDTFFDEKGNEDRASEELVKMIDAAKRSVRTDIRPGAKVTGTVTRIGSEYVFVDIGAKSEAVLAVAELTGKSGAVTVTPGDKVSAFVVSDASGEIVMSRSLSGKGRTAAVQELCDALNDRVPVQGKVTGVAKAGLSVKVLGHRAFCPVSQIDLKYTDDINQYLGKTMDFMITRISEGGRNVVLSRIPLLEAGLEKKIDALEKAAEARFVLKGTVSRITDFGLFVDLGDCEGLVHISEVSWERAENLATSFRVGQEVECIVLGVEKKSPLRASKISLSIKQTLDDPWKSVAERFSPGQTVSGRVTRLMPFGAFVELVPGVEGLVHVSEMSWVKRVHHPSDVVTVGQEVRVVILALDETKKTVSLSLKDLSSDPWKDAQSRFAPGSDVTGTVARKAKFGYFIDLANGVTGLLALPNIAADKKGSVVEGEQITVHVESIDMTQRRLSLSLGRSQSRQDAAEVQHYMARQEAPATPAAPKSTEFGAALLEALKKKRQ